MSSITCVTKFLCQDFTYHYFAFVTSSPRDVLQASHITLASVSVHSSDQPGDKFYRKNAAFLYQDCISFEHIGYQLVILRYFCK